jgi:hypothetical protein
MAKDIAAVFSMFLDPASAVERIGGKWIWTIPMALLGVVSALLAWVIGPLSMRIVLRNPPDGMSREQLRQSLAMAEKFAGVGIVIAPLTAIAVTLVLALLLLVACQVLGISGRFPQFFNLVSMASIVKVVGALASFAVIVAKGPDIQSMEELSPPFGLDLLLPEGTNHALLAAVNYFSIFQVWFLIVLALGLAAFAKTSKGKAFLAITPLWALPLCMAVIGSLLRR